MPRRIAFVGNCQLGALRMLYDRFAGSLSNDQTSFVPSWTDIDESGSRALANADLIVSQVQSFTGELPLPAHLAATPRVSVPLVSGSFLWPFGGAAHPSNGDSPFLRGGPYPGEFGDGFLNRLIRDAVPAEQALVRYRQHNVVGSAALDRRYELTIHQQRSRDEICDFSIATEIEAHFRHEPLFLSPHHPGLRVTRALAVQCFQKMGVPDDRIEMLARDLNRAPFPQVELPLHPIVSQHFDLSYGKVGADYYWHGEGRFTWDEWVLRYMAYSWSPSLFEGWAIASTNPRKASTLLASALEILPRSPLGHAGMAKALLAMNDLDRALEHAAEAVRSSPQEPEFARIGAFIASRLGRRQQAVEFAMVAVTFDAGNSDNLNLLAKLQEDAGDFIGAEASRRACVRLQPSNAMFITSLGTTLAQLNRLDEALACYESACSLAPEQPDGHFGASKVLATLGRAEESVQEVETALHLRSDAGPYYSHYGHMLLRIGRRSDGIAAFRKALEHDPANVGIQRLLTDLAVDQQDAQVPNEPAARARQLARRERIVDAIEAYREAIRLAPTDTALLLEMGALYTRLGRFELASAALVRAIDPGKSAVKPISDLITALTRMGRLPEARHVADRAASAQPAQIQLAAMKADLDSAAAEGQPNMVNSVFMAIETTDIVGEQEFTPPPCLRYTNISELNPIFGAHHVDHLYVEKKRWVPAVKLCRLPGHTCLAVPNGEEFIAFAGCETVAEQVRSDWTSSRVNEAVAICDRQASINEPAVLIGRYGIRTWGHWLGELLPKIVAVEARWPGRFRFILPDRFDYDRVHVTAVQSLHHYGITKDRLILVAPRMTYHCSDLYVVTSVWSADRMLHPGIAALMRGHRPDEQDPAPGWIDVALLRRSTRTRNIVNIAEVEATLVSHGFAIVDIEELNFRQQVDLFRNVRSVVGVLGSGLTGLMYAPRGVRVLTLAPAKWGDLFFYSMMQDRNAAFADIRGHSTETGHMGVATSAFNVPINALVAGLDAIRNLCE